MAEVTITGLPNAATLTGTERVPMDQAGATVDASAQAIADLATAATVGLGNVNNTSDASKPISTATQTALDLKAAASAISNINNTSDLAKPISTATQTALDLKAAASHTQAASTITGLATVATSGVYTDLTSRPTLGTAAPLDVAATGDASATQVVRGNDARLSDARTPAAHNQAASTITGLGGAAVLGVGTTSGTVAAGDDNRITGALSTATAASTYQPLTANLTSLGAQAPSYYLDRASHTGTQAASTVTGLAAVATTGSASDLATGTLPAERLPATAVSAGAYGSSTLVPVITIGTDGRITAASTAAVSGGTVLYNRRPALHCGSLFYKTAATTISATAGAVLNGTFYAAATAVTMPSSFTNNTDYAIWQHPTTGALVADASFTTAPADATGGSIVGGFHYIPSGRPTAFNNGSPTAAAEILEFSIWDLTWRPSCPDPRGMACIEGGFWIDLYLCGATSYAGTTFSAVPSSRIGLTIGDGASAPLVPAQFGGDGTTTYGSFTWYEASEMAASFGKRLPYYAEFAAAAYGAPEAGSRGADPGTVIWERVSKFGLAQATGTLWQWGADTAGSGAGASYSASTEGRGSVYSTDARAVILGGSWSDGANSGSRNAYWTFTPWRSAHNIGARFAAVALVLG